MRLTHRTRRTRWPLRPALVAATFVVGALLGWGAEELIARADTRAATWAAVPDRSAAQLGDLTPGAPVLQTVALAEPDDATGLAVYAVQEEDCETVTETYQEGGQTRTRTRTRCEWDTVRERRPDPLSVLSLDGRVRLTVRGGRFEGAQRYVPLEHSAYGDDRRAVGWREGDALLIVGRAGAESGTLDAQVVSGDSRDAWLSQQRAYGWHWRVTQWLIGLGALALAAWLLLTEEL